MWSSRSVSGWATCVSSIMGMRSSKTAVGPSMRISPVLMLTTWACRDAAAPSSERVMYLSPAMLLSNPDQNQAKRRHQRHGEKHPRDSCDLFAGGYAEQNQRGMELN